MRGYCGSKPAHRWTILRPVSRSSWLFIRGFESVWIEHSLAASLIIAGPGRYREQRDFIDDDALHAFRASVVKRLLAEGWFLSAYGHDRRSGLDRRRVRRPMSERRQPTDVRSERPPDA